MAEPLPKGYDALLASAFDAGVRYGRAGFDRHDGAEHERSRDAYRLWRQRWAGLPHEGPGDATENAGGPPSLPDDLLPPTHPRGQHRQEGLDVQMGHPGGHYG